MLSFRNPMPFLTSPKQTDTFSHFFFSGEDNIAKRKEKQPPLKKFHMFC